MLGYEDGEEMTFSELRYIVERIAANTQLPLSVDLESGYSRAPLKIVEHIQILAELGVVGINLEDSIVEKERVLLPAAAFAEIQIATLQLRFQLIQINIRNRAHKVSVPISISIHKIKLG